MGKRDYRHREPKKQKRDTKKLQNTTTVFSTPVSVEVIGKRKKKRKEEVEVVVDEVEEEEE